VLQIRAHLDQNSLRKRSRLDSILENTRGLFPRWPQARVIVPQVIFDHAVVSQHGRLGFTEVTAEKLVEYLAGCAIRVLDHSRVGVMIPGTIPNAGVVRLRATVER
jgi:hypothetical protein